MISAIFVDNCKSEIYLGKLNGTVIVVDLLEGEVKKELNFFQSSIDILQVILKPKTIVITV
jgi:hypothetical protein